MAHLTGSPKEAIVSGMHAAALGQLGPNKPCYTVADVGLDATEPVEIVLLSEDRSQQAAQILQQQGRKSKPIAQLTRHSNAVPQQPEVLSQAGRAKSPDLRIGLLLVKSRIRW
eukprot:s2024_g19.t1